MAIPGRWATIGDGVLTEVTAEKNAVVIVHRSREGGEHVMVIRGLAAVRSAWLLLGEAVRRMATGTVVVTSPQKGKAARSGRRGGGGSGRARRKAPPTPPQASRPAPPAR